MYIWNQYPALFARALPRIRWMLKHPLHPNESELRPPLADDALTTRCRDRSVERIAQTNEIRGPKV